MRRGRTSGTATVLFTGRYVTHAPELHLGRHGGQLTRLIPELAETVPGLADPLRSDPETERYCLPTSASRYPGPRRRMRSRGFKSHHLHRVFFQVRPGSHPA
jgi:hypothetical protein